MGTHEGRHDPAAQLGKLYRRYTRRDLDDLRERFDTLLVMTTRMAETGEAHVARLQAVEAMVHRLDAQWAEQRAWLGGVLEGLTLRLDAIEQQLRDHTHGITGKAVVP